LIDRRQTFSIEKKEMSLVLNQPKWQKFLSLKRQRNIINEPILIGDAKESNIPQIDSSEKQSTVFETPPTKKRKRSEEEIALRKAKKLKSKKKDGQEWKHNEDETTAKGEAPESKPQESAKTPMSDAAPVPLLATKAKEIAKARREEKLREKQKRAKELNQDTSDMDQKPSQVLQYLEEYHSHIKSGSEWKFKKQHQTWIVKNLYTYAWESDDLVIPYLKSVQGQVRQRLALGAKELIEDKEGAHGEDVIGRAERVLKALAE
jgi:WKF domain